MLWSQSFQVHIMQCVASILQRIYTRGLAKNIKLLSGKLLVHDLKVAFDTAVQALQRDAPEVEEYLSSIGYENFAFACFPLPRFGHDTSNIVESTNSVWREIRELPHFSFLMGYINGILQHFIKDYQLQLVPGNSVLSNSAYQAYKQRI